MHRPIFPWAFEKTIIDKFGSEKQNCIRDGINIGKCGIKKVLKMFEDYYVTFGYGAGPPVNRVLETK